MTFGKDRQLGFPTANIQMPPHQLLPGPRVYAGYVHLGDRRLPASVSVGYNVQFGGQQIAVEAYILDFDEDLYGVKIGLELVSRVREERGFESVDALIAQIRRDVDQVRAMLGAGAAAVRVLVL